jgi:hypothetical protein
VLAYDGPGQGAVIQQLSENRYAAEEKADTSTALRLPNPRPSPPSGDIVEE